MKTTIGAILTELEGKEPEDEFPYDELEILIEYLCSIVPVDQECGHEDVVDPFQGIDIGTVH